MPWSAAKVRYTIREGRQSNKPWHERSAKNKRYMDGDSIPDEDKRKLKEREQKVVVINIIKPAANLLIGMLACTPMDFDAKPMVQTAKETGKQATWGLKQIATLNDLDVQRRRVGEDAIVRGMGAYLSGAFVRDENPEVEATQVVHLPVERIWYDLACRDWSGHDCRFMGTSHWWPIKKAIKQFPGHKAELEGLRGKYSPPSDNVTKHEALYATSEPASMPLPYLWGADEWSKDDHANELNLRKDEVMIHEVFYRDTETAHFYRSADGHVHKYDPEQQIEVLFDPNVTEFWQQDAPIIRRAWMAGPYILGDDSLGDDSYPITLTFWDRDGNGAPLSFVEQVSNPQEEVNARRSRAWWEVAGQRVQLEDEYLEMHTEEDIDELQKQVAKPNGIIKGSGVMPWPDKASEHMAFVGMSKMEVREAGAVTETLMGEEIGKSPRSAESKRQSTVQAGMGFEAHRLDFIYSFKKLGQRLLRLMIQHHKSPWPVLVSDALSGRDQLTMIDPDDIPYMIALVVGPASDTMRDKMVDSIIDMLPKLPPDAQLQAEGMLAVLDALSVPGVEPLQNALRGYLERLEMSKQMAGPPPPKESVSISIPVDKIPAEIGVALIEKYTGVGGEASPPPEALPASLEAAAQGAHRPRQDRVSERVAAALNTA